MPLKRTLAETDSNAERVSVSKKGKTRVEDTPRNNEKDTFAKPPSPTPTSPPLDEDGRVLANAHDNTWICMCRPRSDILADLGDDADEDELEHTCGQPGKCVCRRPASTEPGSTWVVTKKGYELALEWGQQQAKRTQDGFNLHIFNDWNGYGISEVIENAFLAFAKVANKTFGSTRYRPDTPTLLAIWSRVEGLALFLNGDIGEMQGELQQHPRFDWYLTNSPGIESQDNAKRIMLTGTMLLHTLDLLWIADVLQKRDDKLFCNDSAVIPNLGLILAHFIKFAEDWKETCRLNEDGWKYLVIEKADKHGVEIRGLSGIESLVDNIRKNTRDEDSDYINPKSGTRGAFDEVINWSSCYLREDWCGVVTSEKLNRGTRRSWSIYNFQLELATYKAHQAVKVGPFGPEYGGNIGGKFYDLTAQRNKGSHMREFRL